MLHLFTLLLVMSSAAEAKNCTKGKPCGNSCIAVNKQCHSGGSYTYVPPTTTPKKKPSTAPTKQEVEPIPQCVEVRDVRRDGILLTSEELAELDEQKRVNAAWRSTPANEGLVEMTRLDCTNLMATADDPRVADNFAAIARRLEESERKNEEWRAAHAPPPPPPPPPPQTGLHIQCTDPCVVYIDNRYSGAAYPGKPAGGSPISAGYHAIMIKPMVGRLKLEDKFLVSVPDGVDAKILWDCTRNQAVAGAEFIE